MSNSSITPYAGAATGGVLATLATGAGTVGVVGAGGAFALPFLPVLGLLGLAGWTLGKAYDAITATPAPRRVIDVTPIPVVIKKEVRIPWQPNEVYGTFAELI